MQTQYIDKTGIQHDLDIYQSFQDDERISTIHKDGNYFFDLVRDEERWVEPYPGSTERATEYGDLIDKLKMVEKQKSA